MSARARFFSRLPLVVLLPLAVFSTLYLYLYPLFNGCAFPRADASQAGAWRANIPQHLPVAILPETWTVSPAAPFRLLVLADPQLEGDSSLPNSQYGFIRRFARHWDHLFQHHRSRSTWNEAIKNVLKEIIHDDVPHVLYELRKRLDLTGNDYYLAHIFRTLRWWTRPTHIAVLGDLLGSQWVSDDEFDARAWRYWKRVFAGGRRVDHSKALNATDQAGSATGGLDDPVLGEHRWDDRIINIAGNHDIGYAAEVSRARLARFEESFGPADWDVRFQWPSSDVLGNHSSSPAPSLHIIVLNDLVLDTPVLDPNIQSNTYGHLNSIITHRSRPVKEESSFTLLLTHVPLYKPQGVCVDPPLFNFYDSNHYPLNHDDFKPGGLREQNHLSDHVSRSGILQGLYGMSADRHAPGNGIGRKGLILTGHDHEGCDTWHHIPDDSSKEAIDATTAPSQPHEESRGWESTPWPDANMTASHTGIREITLRSMMGEFGGNAGLLSLWFDFESNQWQYEMQMCPLGVQHIWWGVHGLDFVTFCSGILVLVLHILSWRRKFASTTSHRNHRNTSSISDDEKRRRKRKDNVCIQRAARDGSIDLK